MKTSRLTLVVALVVVGIVAASLYAIADSCKSGCGAGAAASGCAMSRPAAGCGAGVCGVKPAGCGLQAAGCGMKRAAAPILSRSYSGGLLKLRVGGCGRLFLAVLEQANRPDSNASVSADLYTAAGRQAVPFKAVKPGLFVAPADLSAGGKLVVRVGGGGAMTDTVSFDLAARGAKPCGSVACKCGAGCKPGAAAGTCSKLGAGGCAAMGACKQQGARTAACKCEACKCAPCQCK